MKVKSESEVAQSCLTLSDSMDYSLPGFCIHGIFQARVLEWGAIAFSSGTISNAPTYELYKSQKKKRKRKGMRNFLKIILENFPDMEKEIVNQVQETQRVPYKINSRRNMPKHILIKLTKTKHKKES